MHICLYLLHSIEQCACSSANTGVCANSISLGKLGRELLTIESIHVIFLLEFVVCLQIGPLGTWVLQKSNGWYKRHWALQCIGWFRLRGRKCPLRWDLSFCVTSLVTLMGRSWLPRVLRLTSHSVRKNLLCGMWHLAPDSFQSLGSECKIECVANWTKTHNHTFPSGIEISLDEKHRSDARHWGKRSGSLKPSILTSFYSLLLLTSLSFILDISF